MPFYGDDFYGGVGHLTPEQESAYKRVLWTMWKSPDGTVGNNYRTLMRPTRVHPRNWSRVWAEVVKMFTILDDGRITQKRLQVELQIFTKRSESRREPGSRGGKARSRKYATGGYPTAAHNPLKNKDVGQAIASTLHTSQLKEEYKSQTSTPIPLNDNLPENQKSGLQKEALVELSAPQQAAEFETFWSAYPRKEDWGAARLAYFEALKRAPAAELLAGAKRYAKAKSGEDLKFTKIPKNWLNGDGWRDELAKPFNVAAGPWKLLDPAEPPRVSTPEELAAREAQVEEMLAARGKPTKAEMELKIKRLARDTRRGG